MNAQAWNALVCFAKIALESLSAFGGPAQTIITPIVQCMRLPERPCSDQNHIDGNTKITKAPWNLNKTAESCRCPESKIPPPATSKAQCSVRLGNYISLLSEAGQRLFPDADLYRGYTGIMEKRMETTM